MHPLASTLKVFDNQNFTLLKVSKKTIQHLLLKLIYLLINVKFIFIINTFASSNTNQYLWISGILKYPITLPPNIQKELPIFQWNLPLNRY